VKKKPPRQDVFRNQILEDLKYIESLDTEYFYNRKIVVPEVKWTCPVCGGRIIGDGYTTVRHCENVEAPEDAEPDGNTYFCKPRKAYDGDLVVCLVISLLAWVSILLSFP